MLDADTPFPKMKAIKGEYMKLFKVNYEYHKRGSLLVKAKSRDDVPDNFFQQHSLDEIINACFEGDGPYFCENCDIEEFNPHS